MGHIDTGQEGIFQAPGNHEELSELERMGVVIEYFFRSGAYKNLETYSARGWPRPVTDRYYPEMTTADPVYAVWGQRK
ncbi:MAG: hypothetical protein JSV01_07205 [Desulfobacterales bacterium]|nr:MAG: hypothetical protein JSV01_07205 [Desulfobacterales bacterium]UCG81975.1 MAG: hypothetical protein JSV60_09490 [Desulfobacterales bacterium]